MRKQVHKKDCLSSQHIVEVLCHFLPYLCTYMHVGILFNNDDNNYKSISYLVQFTPSAETSFIAATSNAQC